MLNPWLLGLARAWAPRIMLPFSMFIGYVGEVEDIPGGEAHSKVIVASSVLFTFEAV